MNDPMRILKADHREVERLLEELGDSDEGTERAELLEELRTKLTLHMEIEENLVYPLVREHLGDQDEEEAEVEHGLAREGVQKLIDLMEAPGFGAAVEMLQGGIGHHVREEEQELLPELKESIEREQWLELGDAVAAAKEAAGQPLPPPARRRSAKRTSSSSSKTASRSKASASKR
jgi:hemerythrin-like domain-containing protein